MEPLRTQIISTITDKAPREESAGRKTAQTPEPRVLVLLCTYNESANIVAVVSRLRSSLPQADVLVVDDSSPDGTAELVQKQFGDDQKVHLEVRSGKLGLGNAIKFGMQWSLSENYDYLVNLDADLSHDPESVVPMLATAMKPGNDVAVGSRYIPGGGIPGLAWHRRLISVCLNRYATKILRLPITDCSGSFRCYSLAALRNIDLSKVNCAGYGFLEEVLVALCRSGAQLAEVPIHYRARNGGESKLGISDAVGALKVIHLLALKRR